MDWKDRLAHAWSAFTNSSTAPTYENIGSSYAPRRSGQYSVSGERTLMASITTRLAIEVAAVDIRHAKLDKEDRFLETVRSGLQYCLNVEANVDQTGSVFRQEIAQTLFTNGVCAVVPVDTTLNPELTGGYDILTMRVGDVVEFYPQHVLVRVYDERVGRNKEIVLPKKMVAIIYNPLYAVMNEPNSTLQRLRRKLALLDTADEAAGSSKLDIIIQLPYVVKSEARKEQAERRRKDIEFQLSGGTHGIAYVDGTERITQLNRPAENQILSRVEYLTKELYAQLGLTPEIFMGTAEEAAVLHFYNTTIAPVLRSITEELHRKFLTKTARSQGQAVKFYRNPFSLVPVSQIAEIADKFTRNEIMTSNEIRDVVGLRPSNDPKADELRNKNLSAPSEDGGDSTPPVPPETPEVQKKVKEERNQNES